MELSTYFRINASNTGQFERTLIIAEDDSYVSYLEGCTAPAYDDNQLHAAVVELSAAQGAEIKYSTVQNWYAGDTEGKGGIFNFVTKRGLCHGARSKISWTQVRAAFVGADKRVLICAHRQTSWHVCFETVACQDPAFGTR
jgi:Fe-S cluster assembly protein SufB